MSVSDLLQPNVRSRTAELAVSFSAARPFRHVVMDEFLQRDAVDALIREFPSFDAAKAVNEMGEVGRKAVVSALPQSDLRIALWTDFFRTRPFLP